MSGSRHEGESAPGTGLPQAGARPRAGASGATARRRAARQAAMPFILATVLIDMIAIGLIVPVLPLP